jgi:carboxymethylenebutenolidase
MGTDIEITASDGHTFAAYRADPSGAPKGGILVVQEAFGVNPHIRHMADTYAAAGYLAIAPALYDRVERGIEVGYTGEGREKGIGAMQASNFDDVIKDIDATRALLAEAGKVGVTGWCWGGSVTFLSACRVDGLACASSYYGGRVPDFVSETPKCPLEFHWGETDASIPMEKVRAVEAQHPDVASFVYPAGHGFMCDDRESYHKESAELSHKRTMEMFAQYVG